MEICYSPAEPLLQAYFEQFTMDPVNSLAEALSNAVTTNTRPNHLCVLSLVFEQDDTNALGDIASFSRASRRHFEARSTQYVMSGRVDVFAHVDQAPEAEIPADFGRGDTDDVLVVHYVGHGTNTLTDGGVRLALMPTSTARASTWLTFPGLEDHLSLWAMDRPKIRILYVMDCCYAGSSVFRVSKSVSEVVYAAPSTGTTAARGSRGLSFTQRFLSAINEIRSQSPRKSTLDPVEVIAHLEKNAVARGAGHAVLCGGSRISLYFAGQDVVASHSASPSKERTAKVLLQLSMPEDITDPSVKKILAALRQLSSTVANVEVLSVDQTGSTTILLRAAATWGMRMLGSFEKGTVITLLHWSFDHIDTDWQGSPTEPPEEDSDSGSTSSRSTRVWQSSPPSSPTLMSK